VKLIRDILLVFQRHLLIMRRSPLMIILGVAQPVIYMILFAPLLKRALVTVGANSMVDAYRIYVPGMLTALAIGTGLYVGFNLLAEISQGIIERCRVTSISRVALIIGRAMRDVSVVVIQAIIITILSIPFGLFVRIDRLLLAYAILALITMFTASVSYGLALKVASPASMGQIINNISQPLMLLSGTLLPITLAPLWIQDVANYNPFAWAVAGLRKIFAGHPEDYHVWLSIVLIAGLVAIALTWSTRLFAKTAK